MNNNKEIRNIVRRVLNEVSLKKELNLKAEDMQKLLEKWGVKMARTTIKEICPTRNLEKSL